MRSDMKVHPGKEYVAETLSMFDGVWSGTIKFDGKPYFNFFTEHACPIEDYPEPLESDSRYRADLQALI
jgi:hypothetical protein